MSLPPPRGGLSFSKICLEAKLNVSELKVLYVCRQSSIPRTVSAHKEDTFLPRTSRGEQGMVVMIGYHIRPNTKGKRVHSTRANLEVIPSKDRLAACAPAKGLAHGTAILGRLVNHNQLV